MRIPWRCSQPCLRRGGGRIQPQQRLRLGCRGWITSLALIGAVALLPARAGEVTVESIIDQSTALREASEQVPAGNRIMSTECSQVALPGLSYRYRCSVRFIPAAAAPAP